MKSSQVTQFPDLHQQTCTVCQKLKSAQNNTGLCSSGCTDLFSHTMWAFVQGFLLSCVLCFCKNSAVKSQLEPEGVSGNKCLVHSDDRLDQNMVSSDSVETNSALSSAGDESLPKLKTKLEEAQMNETDLDNISMPVHLSLDSHIDLELEMLESEMPEVKGTEEVIAILPSESVDNIATCVTSEQSSNSDSVSLVISQRTSVVEMVLSKANTACYSQSVNNEQNATDSNGVQQTFDKVESYKKQKKSKKLDYQSESDSDSMHFSLKRLHNKHSCIQCCKSFGNKQLLNQHIRTHCTENKSLKEESQQNFTCEFCAQSFMNRYSLKAHIRRKHSGEEPVECDICGKVQPGSFALSTHKRACHNFNSLCHICGAEFSGRTSFDKHMACHEGVRRYFCDICGAGFVHNSSLNNHSSVHLTTKSYQCDICSQLFKAQHLLNGHLLKAHQCGPSLEQRIRGLKKMGVEVDRAAIKRHANKQCLVCGEPLVNGMCLSHPDMSKEVFHCPTCGDKTSNIVLFYQHIKWHKGMIISHNHRTGVAAEAPPGCRLTRSEPGSSQIKCEVCSKTFKNFEYLSAHMHQHREARFACDVCNKRFTYKCNLKTHMNTHLDTWQFECETCQKKFRDKYTFKKHQLKHTEPQFKCQVCGKSLTRRPYLLKHYQKMHPEYQESLH